jgi:RNA polymerase sigma factor (sigma-70 family)
MAQNRRGSGGRFGYVAGLDAAFCAYHAPHVRARLLRMGVMGADVDDLVQHTFVVAQNSWDQRPRGRRKERSWLEGIAWRLGQNLHRYHARRHEQLGSEALDMVLGDELDLDELIDMRRLFTAVFTELLIEDREMLLDYFVDDVPLTEIAHRHGLPRSTAWSRIQKLRRYLAERVSSPYGVKRME